jgi:hypothetical protein
MQTDTHISLSLSLSLSHTQEITSEQINLLKQENEEKIRELQQAMLNAEHLSAKEKARMEAERAAEIKRLQVCCLFVCLCVCLLMKLNGVG